MQIYSVTLRAKQVDRDRDASHGHGRLASHVGSRNLKLYAVTRAVQVLPLNTIKTYLLAEFATLAQHVPQRRFLLVLPSIT